MEEEERQKRLLILLASVVCAVLIGYNAFYVPDATIVWSQSSSFASGASVSSEGGSRAAFVQFSSKRPESRNRTSGRLPEKSPPSRKSGKINLNTASAQELSDGLNGIGKVLAKRIVDYREKNGPFHSIEEVKNVSGIGDKIFERIRDSLTVS